MTVKDYRTIRTFPAFKNHQGKTTWDEIKFPENCNRVQIGSTSGVLYVTHDGTDDAAVGGANTDKAFIPQNNYLTFHLGRGSSRDNVLYVAGSTGTPDISIILEEI